MPMVSVENKEGYTRPELLLLRPNDEGWKLTHGILSLQSILRVLPLPKQFSVRNPPVIGGLPRFYSQRARDNFFLRRSRVRTFCYSNLYNTFE